MKEHLKTLLLAVLVIGSLVQSYMLAYSTPQFDTIIPTGYVQSKLEGNPKEASQLMNPKEIAIYFGDGEHTLLYPQMTFYRMIMERIEERTFEGLRVMSTPLEELVPLGTFSETARVELRFNGLMPISLVQHLFNLEGAALGDQEVMVDRIQMFAAAPEGEVKVLLLGDSKVPTGELAYEIVRVDLTSEDVEQFIGFGESRMGYTTVLGKFDLPAGSMQLPTYQAEYRIFSADQLRHNLFPDPSSTRNLRERDGSEIYTDGKRGLQLSTERQWMSYSDPAAPFEGAQSAWETVLSAVQFVNRHGGWDGEYMLIDALLNEEGLQEHTLDFRQYVGNYKGAYPILMWEHGSPFGTVILTLRNGVVTNYDRSLVQIKGTAQETGQATLIGGTALREALVGYEDISLVKSVFPAYTAAMTDEHILLKPVWALAMMDGSYRAL